MIKRSDIKQEDIIKSAIEVFSQKGFNQASMEGISKQAGVSKRTLYKYYPNKEALFDVIVDNLMCRFDEQYDVEFEPSQPVDQQLLQLTLKQMCYISNQDFQLTARLVMAECIRCQETSKLLVSKFESIEDSYGLQKWAQQGIDAGVLQIPDIGTAIEQYVGSIKAVVFWPQLVAHLPPPTGEQVEQAVKMAVASFVATYQINDHQ
ncbi:TetR/AcrR family transcriptional regulator [Vibrio sp. JPW-9-11-11]|uniref:TetR/AcrR family transcriptional regulator n=1 Tax=Vibrio sp. JPW-9-11-11 TaxID=1416532 RepID=UPI0015940E78|nr:TetR/AcrR family transcriptional regulator [Vibrio sp. JPW-9-11-11]NVD08503.1 TetR/AcrR family transcriptional regulator [Vibrio sp. JPW-9-11-11]